jgi:ankyrin repeat protein
MPTLTDLPLEILLIIWSYLDKEREMNALVRSCQLLYTKLNLTLYRHNLGHGSSAVRWAAENSRIDTMLKLIDAGYDLHEHSNEHQDSSSPSPPPSPLCVAAYAKQEAMVAWLLSQGVDPDTLDEQGLSPLVLAGVFGHLGVAKLLVRANADLEGCSEKGWTPFAAAVNNGHEEVALYLLEQGTALFPVRDTEPGLNPLVRAAREGITRLVELILERMAATMESDAVADILRAPYLMSEAISEGNTEVVKLLVAAGAPVTHEETGLSPPLSWAVYKNKPEIAKVFLDRGASLDIRIDSRTPLWWAASHGYTEMVRLLLAQGVPADYVDRGERALGVAAQNGDTETVALLLEAGADIEATGWLDMTPLHIASRSGQDKVVAFLLAHGASPHTASRLVKLGPLPPISAPLVETALTAAARHGHQEVVRLLLDAGISTESRLPPTDTALFLAASRGHVEVIKLLLEKGADLTYRSKHGYTVLSCAAQRGHPKAVLALLEHCKSHLTSEDYHNFIDAADDCNRTPLFFGVLHGHADAVRLLLAGGSRAADTPSDSKRTPRSIAAANNQLVPSDSSLKPILEGIWQSLSNPTTLPGEPNLDCIHGSLGLAEPLVVLQDFCAECEAPISPLDCHYYCTVCRVEGGRSWEICADCSARGAHCLDLAHQLVRQEADPDPYWVDFWA